MAHPTDPYRPSRRPADGPNWGLLAPFGLLLAAVIFGVSRRGFLRGPSLAATLAEGATTGTVDPGALLLLFVVLLSAGFLGYTWVTGGR